MPYIGNITSDFSIDTGNITNRAVTATKLSPSSVGSNGQVLSVDGSGNLQWGNDANAPEGTAVLSTGESGTTKFLRIDGDGTCSWQVPPTQLSFSNDANNRIVTGTGSGLNGEANLTFNGSGDLTVKGNDGITANLYLIADRGDDDGDGWRIGSNQDDNDLTIANNTSGSYVDKITLLKTGEVTFTGTVKIPTVAGTNTDAALNVLFQTGTGVIDGGSSLTFNPANDLLSVNNLSLTSQQILGKTTQLKLACANNSSTQYITISDKIVIAGNVGIGTTSPSTPLHVKNAGSTACRFILENTGSGSDDSTQIWSQNNDLAFNTNDSERMRIDSDGDIEAAGNLKTNNLSGRNIVINGSQIIDQRNNGSAVTLDNSGVFGTDRFKALEVTDGACTITRFPITDLAKFTRCARLTVTTADASLASGQHYGIFYVVEGHDLCPLRWGTASAQSATLSFWARSSVAGDHSVSIRSANGAESYQFKYTLAANTWTYVTKTIAGPTSGSFDPNTSNRGIDFIWGMAGSGLVSSTLNSWVTSPSWCIAASGSVNVMATNGATFDLTGVQFEKGSIATEFDHRSYGDELAKCQRYYIQYGGAAATDNRIIFEGYTKSTGFATCHMMNYRMRAAPAITHTAINTWANSSIGSVSFNYRDANQSQVRVIATGNDTNYYMNTDADSYLYIDAEI